MLNPKIIKLILMDLGYRDLSSTINIWHGILFISRVSNYLPKASKFYKMHN